LSESLQSITYFDLIYALIPVGIVFYIFYRWELKYSTIIYAHTRMFIQLIAIGYCLKYIFNSSHPTVIILILFISFFSLIVVARTSKTILNSSCESGHSCLFPDFRGNAFNFSPLRMMFAVCLSYIGFIMLRYVPSLPDFRLYYKATVIKKI